MLLFPSNWTLVSVIAAVAVCVGLLVPYFRDFYRIRKYPGPLLARFTYGWLLWAGVTRRRSRIIHELHEKYGPIIRISPSEISFSSPAAHADIYSFNSKVSKSRFYDAFATIGLTNVFTTRSRTEHGQKRKLLHPIFTAEVAREFSIRTSLIISTLLDEWAARYAAKDDYTWFDCVPWITFLSFDEMADFIFGEPFGMIRAVSDAVLMPKDPRLAFDHSDLPKDYPLQEISLMQVISKRETYNYIVGVLPPWWKAVGRRVLGSQARASVIYSGFIAHKVFQRLTTLAAAPGDLVGRFLDKTNAQNETFHRDSLISELITILVAGSDTTRKLSFLSFGPSGTHLAPQSSLIAAIYYLAKSPDVQRTLQNELDLHMTSLTPAVADIEDLPLLGACLNETLRLFSPVAIGLPRTVPAAGLIICGEAFIGGTTVGVPIYSLHRDQSVWGDNPEEFRPERWLHDGAKKSVYAFKPFSDGPATCIGKQLALVQLRVMIAAIFKRFDVVLEDPASPLHVEDWFVRRATHCRIAVRPR
ncbi:cytochrome P450 [Mycena vulgaris]|nr:cytochrome P450 [Mycena vulgaris]